MSTARRKTASRPRRAAFFNGQPVELALCRHFRSAMHLGDVLYEAELRELPGRVECIRDWRVAGPFPSPTPGQISLELSTPVEDAFAALGAGRVDLAATYPAGGKTMGWQPATADADGVVDLDPYCGRVEWACAYGYAEIEWGRDEPVLFGLGSDDGIKVWLNGELVHSYDTQRTCLRSMGDPYMETPVQDFVTFRLRRGANRLLLKIANYQLGWGFLAGPVRASRRQLDGGRP